MVDTNRAEHSIPPDFDRISKGDLAAMSGD